jgi:hypothetical protein
MSISDTGVVNVAGLTASQLMGTDASKNLVSLAVATYPSLTELAYVKGVTSAIQTQIDGKLGTSGNAVTATAIASGSANIPAFSAYATGNTTLATSTRTIIAFAAKEFDIGTYYSTSTNLYTPLKAGIYRLSAAITLTTAVALSNYGIEVWKNGAFYKNGTVQNETTTNAELHLTVSCLVSMNGSTDTLSIYGFNGNAVTACTVYGATGYTFFECNYVGPGS